MEDKTQIKRKVGWNPGDKRPMPATDASASKYARTGAGIVALLAATGFLFANILANIECADVSEFDPYMGPVTIKSEPKKVRKWVEDGLIQGHGGESVTKNGVEFYTSGEPKCRYEQMGRLTWAGSSSRDWMAAVAEKVKSVGGSSLLVYEVSILPEQTTMPRSLASIEPIARTISMSKDDTFGWFTEVRKVGGIVVKCVGEKRTEDDVSERDGPPGLG